MIKNCIICNKEYKAGSHAQKTCNNCKVNVCVFCVKDYKIKTRSSSKYCSRECYLKARFGTGKCKLCGKVSKNRFCSKKCRDTHWNVNYKQDKNRIQWKRKLELLKRLGNKCKFCGNTDIRCLEINHIDRSLKGRPKSNKYNLSTRLAEWNKNESNLEILCANCHRVHTWKQMNYGKYI